MDATVLRGVEEADATSFVVAKKRSTGVASTNGLTNGHTNGASGPEITLILASRPTEGALAVASKLINLLHGRDYQTRLFSWGQSDVSALAGKSCISLLETKPVRLQLGLNLDVELELKARLQGDVSLTLL